MSQKKKGIFNRMLEPLFEKTEAGFGFVAKEFSTNISNLLLNIKEIREKSKNIIGSNIEVAEEHLKNNNLFDARLRYKIVLMLNKNNFKALCGLGFIAFKHKKYKKAKEYLKNAFLASKTQEEREEADKYLQNTIDKLNQRDENIV